MRYSRYSSQGDSKGVLTGSHTAIWHASSLHTEKPWWHLCDAGTNLPGLYKIEGRALDWLQVTGGDVLVCHWCVVVPADKSRMLLGMMQCCA